MKRLVLLVTAIAFVLSPAIAGGELKRFDRQKPPAVARSHDGGGHAIKDSWITFKTKMSLMTDKRAKARRIKVETHGAVVTLRGKVSTAAERSAAQEIARGIGGVRGVSNALQVVPDTQRDTVDTRDAELESAVRARIMKDGVLSTASINVRADNAVVTLMGKVRDAHGLARATDIVRAVPGVKAVRNELRQQS